MSYLDFQLLLYVPSEQYAPCRTFYEQVFATQPFYGTGSGERIFLGQQHQLCAGEIVLNAPVLRPLRLAYVPHGGSGGKSHQYLYGANHRRIKRTETVKIKGCSSRPELKREAAYETEPSRKPPPFFRF